MIKNNDKFCVMEIEEWQEKGKAWYRCMDA